MKKIIRLTESDLARIVKRVIKEQNEPSFMQQIKNMYRDFVEGGDIDYNYIENSMTSKELADLIYASLMSGNLDRGRDPKKGKFEPFKDLEYSLPKDFSAPEFIIDGDAEAPVEAAFLNMSKPLKKEGDCPECIKKYNEVVNLYKQRFHRDMMKDVKDRIDINRKYHKKSIKSCMNSWGKKGVY